MRLFIFLLPFLLPLSTAAQLTLSVESGMALSQYNDVQVPNGDDLKGTQFSLHDDFNPQASAFIRIELKYLISDKHSIELTAAPLQLDFEDAKIDPINFANTAFAGENIDGRYEFNTYRLTYRYRLINNPNFIFDLGASILMRDARIALMQNDLLAEDTDLGFVPLISFQLNYLPNAKLSVLLKGDALVGPQGRAEDIFGGILYQIAADRLKLKAGYRFIEGGADVDQVYNFAYIHFADVGLVYTF